MTFQKLDHGPRHRSVIVKKVCLFSFDQLTRDLKLIPSDRHYLTLFLINFLCPPGLRTLQMHIYTLYRHFIIHRLYTDFIYILMLRHIYNQLSLKFSSFLSLFLICYCPISATFFSTSCDVKVNCSNLETPDLDY